MASLTLLCLLLSTVTLGSSVEWSEVKVKYSMFMDGMYNIPLTVNDIKNREFVYLENDATFPSASLYCIFMDPRVCPMYDSHGKIAGLRVAYIIEDLKTRGKGELPYSYEKPIFRKVSAYNKEFYYIDVLFISAESLSNGGPPSREEPVGTGVFLKIEGQKWTEMPRKEDDIKNTKFKKQACVPGIGTYYFYDMTPEMKCEDHQPPFLLYDGGELVGLGLVPFGSFTGTHERTWFEDPKSAVVRVIAPQSPPCLSEWVGTYGVSSLHIIFKKGTAFICLHKFRMSLTRPSDNNNDKQ